MSFVGRPHPAFRWEQDDLRWRFGVEVELGTRPADTWTYAHLARELNFKGCEVLMVDAEGHDVSILRSMMEH